MNQPGQTWRNAWLSIAWFALLMLLAPCAPALGQSATGRDADRYANAVAPQVEDFQVGFAGRYKVGYWTAAEVQLTAGSEPFVGQVVVVAPDNDGIATRISAPVTGMVQIAAGESKRVPVFFKQGQLGGTITVELHNSAGLQTARTFRPGGTGSLAGVLPSSARLLLSVGMHSPEALEADKGTFTPLADFASLSGRWYGLEGVDAILLNTGDPALVDKLTSSHDQRAALDLWIRMGGRLILSVGRNASQLLAAGGPLADFAPGTFQATVPLRQGTVIEAYAETSDPLAPGANVDLQVAQLADVHGDIESFAGSGPRDLPLVIRTARGFGEVVFVAFDLDQPPFADWKARPQLMARLLGEHIRSGPIDASESDSLGAVTTLGFVDLAGQLRGALDQFPGVPLVPFWLVALLIAAYIACIGPVDYYLVRHLLKRPESTWVTFSLTVLLFAGGAAGLAYGLKGRDLRINHLDIVDFDLASGFSRRTSFANVFSPEIATYDVAFKSNFPARSTQHASTPADSGELLSWFGLTGSGFGGMDAAAGAGGGIGAASSNLPLFSVGYQYNQSLDELHGVPIAVWSSKAFVGRAWGQSAGGIEAHLVDSGRLTGTVRNTLAVPLAHCVLIYDKWAYVIRDFAPGRELDLEFDIDPQTVDTYLRKVTAVGDRKVAAPYDQAGFDVPRIVELISAHELVLGKTYTGLANQYQGFLELSDLVARDRAVLIGRTSEPATTLVRRDGDSPPTPLATDEHTQRWTFHRYVIPVAKQ
jgi:hypothetical protein